MSAAGDHDLPDDVEALKALLLAEREAHRVALREQALNIEQLKQTIAKLRHDGSARPRSVARCWASSS